MAGGRLSTTARRRRRRLLLAGATLIALAMTVALIGAGYDVILSERGWAVTIVVAAALTAAAILYALRDIAEFGLAVAFEHHAAV